MKLFTKQFLDALEKYPYRSQDGKGLEAKVLGRFFLPGSAVTWYVLENDEKIENDPYNSTGVHYVYGLVDIGYGLEYGCFSLEEIEKARSNFCRLPAERDFSVKPGKMTLGECMRMYSEDFI